MHSVESAESQENQKKSNSKMLPLVGIEPRASDFHALHDTVWANSLFAGRLRPLDPYIAMLILGLREIFVIFWFSRDYVEFYRMHLHLGKTIGCTGPDQSNKPRTSNLSLHASRLVYLTNMFVTRDISSNAEYIVKKISLYSVFKSLFGKQSYDLHILINGRK